VGGTEVERLGFQQQLDRVCACPELVTASPASHVLCQMLFVDGIMPTSRQQCIVVGARAVSSTQHLISRQPDLPPETSGRRTGGQLA
jgi:hypothetical protein